MGTQIEVVYPSVTGFSGTSQLNLGPYTITSVKTLLRAQHRGMVNFQGATVTAASSEANTPLWAVQFVTHGSSPADVVTTIDGGTWLIRRQLGSQPTRVSWAPASDNGAYLAGYDMTDDWAGQLALGFGIDLYVSMRAPTGASLPTLNLYSSLRFWWA